MERSRRARDGAIYMPERVVMSLKVTLIERTGGDIIHSLTYSLKPLGGGNCFRVTYFMNHCKATHSWARLTDLKLTTTPPATFDTKVVPDLRDIVKEKRF